MRVALLSPLPPAPSGIADYSAELLALLAPRHELDVYHDQGAVEHERLPRSCAVFPCGEFLARHRERPYDVAIYQLGNATAHGFLYDLLARVPGLLVLHDLVLHHARARMFLDSPEARAYARDPSSAALRAAARVPLAGYEAEAAYSYPAQAGRLAEAHLATVGDLLPYAYPLFRIPVEASRLTAVHNEYMARAVREEVPEAEVVRIPLQAEAVAVEVSRVAELRGRLGLAADDFVVGCFGLLTREKRIETVARAVARAAVSLPRVRLLLVGPVPDPGGLEALLRRLGVRERTALTGRVPFAELPAHIAAADLALHLRYPTARETSAALLRLLAQGRCAVISDLEHLADIPGDAVVRVDIADEEGEATRAILRLAGRPELRQALGRRASQFIRREHAPARTLEAYEAAMARAVELPAPRRRDWPGHWIRGS